VFFHLDANRSLNPVFKRQNPSSQHNVASKTIQCLMEEPKFKTKEQFAQELGISKSKLYRLLKKHKILTTGELLNPKVQHELRALLGFPPLLGF
jgi:methylphosphotriester-DNA--protein-cysteine methyltransferase